MFLVRLAGFQAPLEIRTAREKHDWRHPLCRWCYDWHHSDYTDNRPYRPHLVEHTARTLHLRHLLRTKDVNDMPFSVAWKIAEDLVYMWEP